MRYLNLLFVTLFSAFLFASCGGRSADRETVSVDTVDVGEPVIEESDLIKPDSTEADSVDYTDISLPPRRFKDKEQALAFMRESGHWSEYQSGILMRMLDENFPYADRLLNNRHKYFIVVDKASMNVALFDRYGNVVKVYKTACGRNYGTKHKKADSRTPEGFFTAQGIYDSTDWLFTDDNGHTSKVKGQFGPRFIRLNTPVTSQIGIHGTGSPRSLGLRVSHGCIRIQNQAILELVTYAKPGMPIIVNPSKRDAAVNDSEGSPVPTISTGLTPLSSDAYILPSEPKDSVVAVVDSVVTDTIVTMSVDSVEVSTVSAVDSVTVATADSVSVR